MAMNIGRWSAQATLDAKGFSSGIDQMSSGVDRMQRDVTRGIGALNTAGFDTVATSAARAGAAATASGGQIASSMFGVSARANTAAASIDRMTAAANRFRTSFSSGLTLMRTGIGMLGFNQARELFNRGIAFYENQLRTVIEAAERPGASAQMQALAADARILRDNLRETREEVAGLFVTLATGARNIAQSQPGQQVLDAFNLPRTLLEGASGFAAASIQGLEGVGAAFGIESLQNLQGNLNAAMMQAQAPPGRSWFAQMVQDMAPWASQMQQATAMFQRLQEANASFGETAAQALERQLAQWPELPGFIADALREQQRLNDAQRESARQNEAAMAQTRAFAEQARSPFENFQERIGDIMGAGLNELQQARLVSREVGRFQSRQQDTPGIGALDAGSAEVAAIIANASNPTTNAIENVAGILAAERERQAQADAEALRILQEIRQQLEEQNADGMPRL